MIAAIGSKRGVEEIAKRYRAIDRLPHARHYATVSYVCRLLPDAP